MIKKWYAIIRMALLDAEDKYYKDNSSNKANMKYEKTKVAKVKK